LIVTSFLLLGILASGRTLIAAVGFGAAGLLFAVMSPANVIVAPRLPAPVRASAFSLLMGLLVATEAAGAGGAGLAASAVGLVPVCVALGVPALAVGAWTLWRAGTDWAHR
jgi:hypothetical protein